MKVNPNDPAYPFEERTVDCEDVLTRHHYGIPIRLAIGARIMACANAIASDEKREAVRALRWADALIAAYNAEDK